MGAFPASGVLRIVSVWHAREVASPHVNGVAQHASRSDLGHAVARPIQVFRQTRPHEVDSCRLARSSRGDTPFSVLLMDLDHFKEINDKHGHQVGDRVLTNFVQCVEQVLRRPSVIGRYGGEEFIVILPDTTQEQAVQVAERIQSHLRSQTVSPKVTASIGVACSVQAQHDTLSAMIGRADAALYAAKRNGRDRIEVGEMPGDAQLPAAH